MKKLIFLLFAILIALPSYTQGLTTETVARSMQNFMYEEDGIKYYVLPKANAAKVDLLARRSVVLDSVLQVSINKIESCRHSMLFLDAKLDELKLSSGRTDTELRRITKDYNVLLMDIDKLEIERDRFKKERNAARLQRNLIGAGIVGTILIIILIR